MPLSAAAIQAGTLSFLTNGTPYIAAMALLLALVALLHIAILQRRIKKISAGDNGSLEATLKELLADSKENKVFRTELEKYLKLAEARLRQSVQGVGVVRFNPFAEGQGGNQSFSVALIDEKGEGVVFSTLYARDRVGVYAKPLAQGTSSFELSGEEKEAVAKAQANVARAKKK